MSELSQTDCSSTHTRAGLFDGRHRLVDAVDELADVLEVSRHLCGQHHVDNRLPKRPELIPVRREGVKVQIWDSHCVVSTTPPGSAATDLSVFLKMLLLLSRTVSWKASAAWWLSSTAVSLYRIASSLPALHRKELVRPGWSTSWTVAAIRAATSSSWSRLLWNQQRQNRVSTGLNLWSAVCFIVLNIKHLRASHRTETGAHIKTQCRCVSNSRCVFPLTLTLSLRRK